MNWEAAIDLNRNPLLRLVAALFQTAGLTPDGSRDANLPGTGLAKQARIAILRFLRPAESAARRLIIIMERVIARRDSSVATLPVRAAPAAPIPRCEINNGRVPAFPLFDRRKRFEFGPRRQGPKPVPRIWTPGITERFVIEDKKPQDDPANAGRLLLRLQSLQRALDDLPGQARRLRRQLATRAHAPPGPRRVPPMRPGPPPGYRAKQVHEVDAILSECHALAVDARDALKPPDT